MKSAAFWTFFDREAKPHLEARGENFAKIFEYLDAIDRPVGIVETGCMREKGNWSGDGASSLLFDRYAETHPGSAVYSVDISENATSLCKTLVSPRVKIYTGDSVAFLKVLATMPPPDLPFLDLLYLDSFDVDFKAPHESAFHHIKELLAIFPLLRPETLVVVDDSPPIVSGYAGWDGFQVLEGPEIGGKGKLIADYAKSIGVTPYFVGYQCAFTNLR